VIRRLDSTCAKYIAANQDIYPPEMREDANTFADLLDSSALSLGYFTDNEMTGWAIVNGSETPPYLHDVGVLRSHQRKGIAKALVRRLLAEMRWRGLDVHYHARTSSYPLLGSVPFLNECGYQIITDRLIPNYYGIECESDTFIEDAHEICIRPIGK
jgi:GNAT superfamily N-acetyltransferase